MKYLFDAWDKLKKDLLTKPLILFLDYDGTLVPIAETPDKALLPDDMREILTGLTKRPQCRLAVISGRTLSDLKRKMDIPNITYVGNHGFEMEGAHSISENLISTQHQEDLTAIRELLKSKLSSLQGVWLEDKGIILTVHFRLAGDRGALLARKIFLNVCQSYLNSLRINIIEGKKVLEVRPPVKWDKGEAALWLLDQWQRRIAPEPIVSMYVGDDFTDEDAFKMLDGVAVTVKVGDFEKSRAHYYLRSQKDVAVLLRQILE